MRFFTMASISCIPLTAAIQLRGTELGKGWIGSTIMSSELQIVESFFRKRDGNVLDTNLEERDRIVVEAHLEVLSSIERTHLDENAEFNQEKHELSEDDVYRFKESILEIIALINRYADMEVKTHTPEEIDLLVDCLKRVKRTILDQGEHSVQKMKLSINEFYSRGAKKMKEHDKISQIEVDDASEKRFIDASEKRLISQGKAVHGKMKLPRTEAGYSDSYLSRILAFLFTKASHQNHVLVLQEL
eukprot:GEMP01004816.1.p1 GENE.GEMP01004816.1~~GEMP01004816.1.p1  ORF type:complete len:245 (+),score=40.15 GEMP01004816.1:1749-2483(+)